MQLELGTRSYDLTTRSLVMGILNRTPDSFYDRGRYWDLDAFYAQAARLVADGADLLDVGGVKAGPGPEVSETEELDRVVPVIAALHDRFDVALSVDTWRATVAAHAYQAGAVIGNDISGFADPAYLGVAAAARAGVVATHIRLGPRIPDPDPEYDDVVEEVARFLADRADQARRAGIPDSRIILDAGLDLGKNPRQSTALLRQSDRLTALGWPMLLSASNKPFLGVLFGLGPGDRAGATMAAHALGVSLGCRIFARPRCAGGPPGGGYPRRRHGGRQMSTGGPGRARAEPLETVPIRPGTAATTAGATSAGSPVILVDGDDPTLIGEAVSQLVDDLVGPGTRDLVVEDHRGEEVDLATVAESCATAPFLSDRRVVIVRDVGRFSTDEVGPLLSYLEDPLASTVLVLAGGGGTVAPRLVAAAKSKGRVLSTKVGARDAHEWVRGRMRAALVRLDPDAEGLVEAHLGQDINRVGALLEVLTAAYGPGARLSVAEVEPYLGEAGAVAPWDLTDAIDSGRTEDALTALQRLLVGGDRHPLVVLAVLHRHVQSLLRVDDPAIASEAQAAAAMGIGKGRSTFPAKKALGTARRWGSARIETAIGLVADAELDLKGASGCPEHVVLEVLVARMCRLGRTSAGSGAPTRRRGH